MANAKDLRELLRKNYGIKSDAELLRKIKATGGIEIGFMTNGVKGNEEQYILSDCG